MVVSLDAKMKHTFGLAFAFCHCVLCILSSVLLKWFGEGYMRPAQFYFRRSFKEEAAKSVFAVMWKVRGTQHSSKPASLH